MRKFKTLAILFCLLIICFGFYLNTENYLEAAFNFNKLSNSSNGKFIEMNLLSIDTFPESGPLVCALVGQEKVNRKEALKKEIFSQMNDIEEIEFGYVFKFSDNERFLLKLIDYIIVEKECCPFFQYDFLIHPYNKGIELKVTGGRAAKLLITTLVHEIQDERK